MDTAFTQKVPFILDRNLAKAKCTGNHVCTSYDRVVIVLNLYHRIATGFYTVIQTNTTERLEPI